MSIGSDLSGAREDETFADIHLRIIAGDADALADFEALIRPRVLGMLRRKGVTDSDSDEAWNDAFHEAIKRVAELEPLGIGLRRFVLAVAHRRGVDAIRRAATRLERPLADNEADRAEAVLQSDPTKEAWVRGCVEAAPPLYAEVTEMTARGLTAAEMAAVVGKSEANVAKIRSRARAWFARCLEGILDE